MKKNLKSKILSFFLFQETKLISRTEKSKPNQLYSIVRKICSTMTSLPNLITILKNPFCGWPESWLEIPTLNLWPCQPCCLQKSKWILNGNKRSNKITKRPKTQPYPRTTKICKFRQLDNFYPFALYLHLLLYQNRI